MIAPLTNISTFGTGRALFQSLERLGSGRRIQRAADDASELAIEQRLKAFEASIGRGLDNLSDGASLVSVAEGGLSQTSDLLSRMRQLAVEGQNGTLDQSQKDAIQGEFDQLSAEVDRIAGSTAFNGNALLDGSQAGGLTIQDGSQGTIDIAITDQSASALGVSGLDITDSTAINTIDGAIDAVADTRGSLGAIRNRIDSRIAQQTDTAEQFAAARSRIGDVDFALEASRLRRAGLLQQAQLLVHGRASDAARPFLNLLG